MLRMTIAFCRQLLVRSAFGTIILSSVFELGDARLSHEINYHARENKIMLSRMVSDRYTGQTLDKLDTAKFRSLSLNFSVRSATLIIHIAPRIAH